MKENVSKQSTKIIKKKKPNALCKQLGKKSIILKD